MTATAISTSRSSSRKEGKSGGSCLAGKSGRKSRLVSAGTEEAEGPPPAAATAERQWPGRTAFFGPLARRLGAPEGVSARVAAGREAFLYVEPLHTHNVYIRFRRICKEGAPRWSAGLDSMRI